MLIVANWKAYVDSSKKAKALFASAKRLKLGKGTDVVLAPPFTYLAALASGNHSKVRFAGQDVSDATGGAATGAVTAAMLKDSGASYAIVGHSERRAQGETDVLVATKAQRALEQGLTPILCVGERERDADAAYLSFVRAQIAAVFAPLSSEQRLQIVIAYEPIWAIGKSASDALPPQELSEMVLYIRKVLSDYLPEGMSEHATILYGGSVEPSNARSLAAGSGINGFLVGHASAEPVSFTALVKAAS